MKRYAPNVQPLVSFSSFHTLRYKRYQFEFSYFRELFFWNNTLHFLLIQHDKSIFEAVLHGHEASSNRPFSSSKNSHFQNKAKCKYFLVKLNFICLGIKNHFLNKSFTLRACLHGVGDPGLVGLVSFVFTLWGTQNKRNLPTWGDSPLQRSARRSFAPLQKSRQNHRC